MILYEKNLGFTRFFRKLRVFSFLLFELLAVVLPSDAMQIAVSAPMENKFDRVQLFNYLLNDLFNRAFNYKVEQVIEQVIE